MSTIHPRPMTCPLCGAAFEGWLVMPTRSRGPLSSDLRRFPEGDDPLPKQLNACPGCGYTGEVSAFEEHAPKATDAIPGLRAGIFLSQEAWEDAHDPMLADRARPEDSTLAAELAKLGGRIAAAVGDPALRWENHAQQLRWLGHGPLREGDAWLRAAWMHGDREEAEDDRRCRRRALACYRQGITEKEWFARREDLVIVGYLVGELHRRLGEADEADRWFEQAVAWSSGLQKLEELVELAERQRVRPSDLV